IGCHYRHKGEFIVSTRAVVFPFDLFGSPGTSVGATLLGDALREMLDDNRRETHPARHRAYQNHVRIQELSFETPKAVHAWRRAARSAARSAFSNDEFLLWLCGNHLGVLPVLEELGALGDAAVVQFDAHLDVYNLAECTEELSHGNFLLHAESPLPPICHVGHRDQFLLEDHVRRHFVAAISAVELANDAKRVSDRLRTATRPPEPGWVGTPS